MYFEDESPSHSSSQIAFPRSLLCGNCSCLCGKLSVEKGQTREAGRERNAGTLPRRGCTSSDQQAGVSSCLYELAPKCRQKLRARPLPAFMGAVDSHCFFAISESLFVCFLTRQSLCSLGVHFFPVGIPVGLQKLCECVV